jgi:hypothetical protein
VTLTAHAQAFAAEPGAWKDVGVLAGSRPQNTWPAYPTYVGGTQVIGMVGVAAATNHAWFYDHIIGWKDTGHVYVDKLLHWVKEYDLATGGGAGGGPTVTVVTGAGANPTANAPAGAPTAGDLYVNTLDGKAWSYSGTAWVALPTGVAQVVTTSAVPGATPTAPGGPWLTNANPGDVFVNVPDGKTYVFPGGRPGGPWTLISNAVTPHDSTVDYTNGDLVLVDIGHNHQIMFRAGADIAAGGGPLTTGWSTDWELVGEYRIDYPTDQAFKTARDGAGWIRKPVGARCVTRDGEWEVTDAPEVWTKKVWIRKEFYGPGDIDIAKLSLAEHWGMPPTTILDPTIEGNEPQAGDLYFNTLTGKMRELT